ncbi:unnamed protein product [Gordionus sp. m RMFG-2023]
MGYKCLYVNGVREMLGKNLVQISLVLSSQRVRSRVRNRDCKKRKILVKKRMFLGDPKSAININFSGFEETDIWPSFFFKLFASPAIIVIFGNIPRIRWIVRKQ